MILQDDDEINDFLSRRMVMSGKKIIDWLSLKDLVWV